MSALKICPQCGTEYELDQMFCPKDGSTLRSQNAGGDLLGQIVADRYKVMKKLGEGGMGTVYLAEHVKMGRKAALKVMNPGMGQDPDAISRFNREAANASRINHANVAAVYDFGETKEGVIYLAMEFIEGPSLTKVIEETGGLNPVRAADITRQAAEALAVAHDMGIVHRDLKPDNIMLAKGRDGADIVKVVDFGIAKAAADETQKVTKTGLVVGTPEYMSPEQLAGDKLDGRSDTYSLALVAFAMFTGKLPFPADTVQESMIARLTDRPKTLSEMRPVVAWPEAVQAVMDKALERDTGARYQTASEFGKALYKAVSAMQPAARPSGATAVIDAQVAAAPSASSRTAPPAPAAKAPATKPIPATRVQSSSPLSSPAVEEAPAKSKMPLIAAVAAVVVIGGGFGAWKMLGQKANAGAATPTLQSSTTTTNTPTDPPNTNAAGATPPAPVNVPRRLETVNDLVDTNGDSALVLLRAIDAQARAETTPDSTLLQYRYLYGKALVTSGKQKAGCDTLRNLESRLNNSRFKRAAAALIQGCS